MIVILCSEYKLSYLRGIMAACEHSSHSDKFITPLDFEAQNLYAQWEKFKSQFRVFVLAKGINEKPEDVQIANLLMKLGPESVPVYDQFTWESAETKTLTKVQAKFDAHFRPVKNLIFERLRFNQIVQLPGQSIHDFITALQTQAESCEYATMKSELIRDRIVVGVREPRLRQYLVNLDEELTLAVATRRSKQWVAQQEELEGLKSSTAVAVEEDVNALNNSTSTAKSGQNKSHWRKKSDGSYKPVGKSACRKCGNNAASHTEANCPSLKFPCANCKRTGHWAKVCRSPKANVDYVEDDESIGSL